MRTTIRLGSPYWEDTFIVAVRTLTCMGITYLPTPGAGWFMCLFQSHIWISYVHNQDGQIKSLWSAADTVKQFYVCSAIKFFDGIERNFEMRLTSQRRDLIC